MLRALGSQKARMGFSGCLSIRARVWAWLVSG